MLNPTGTTTLISLRDTSGGGAGKGSARCASASGSSSSAAKPELVAMRLDMTVAIDAESELDHALVRIPTKSPGQSEMMSPGVST
jgi:hypothetical protein